MSERSVSSTVAGGCGTYKGHGSTAAKQRQLMEDKTSGSAKKVQKSDERWPALWPNWIDIGKSDTPRENMRKALFSGVEESWMAHWHDQRRCAGAQEGKRRYHCGKCCCVLIGPGRSNLLRKIFTGQRLISLTHVEDSWMSHWDVQRRCAKALEGAAAIVLTGKGLSVTIDLSKKGSPCASGLLLLGDDVRNRKTCST